MTNLLKIYYYKITFNKWQINEVCILNSDFCKNLNTAKFRCKSAIFKPGRGTKKVFHKIKLQICSNRTKLSVFIKIGRSMFLDSLVILGIFIRLVHSFWFMLHFWPLITICYNRLILEINETLFKFLFLN